jgi:hypothetical protein
MAGDEAMPDDPGEDGEDGRMQALVERIQAACAGERRELVRGALVEELSEALVALPLWQRRTELEHTLMLIRHYVSEAE